MLQGRVTRALALGLGGVAALSVLAACGGGGGGGAALPRPIETLERVGVTAIEQATAFACSQDAETLHQAIDIYTELEGKPPADEAALVADGNLREPSKLYDVVDGQITPVDPGCGSTGAVATTPSGSAPMTAPATDLGEIVTSTDPALTAEQMLAEFTPEEIAEVGGQECAGELASIFVAAQNYVAEQGKDPDTIGDLAGYLDQTIELWLVENDALVPAPGSGCVALDTTSASQASLCQAETKTLEVAREAYFAQQGQNAAEPTQQALVDIGFLREPEPDVDLVDGVVTAISGGQCDGVDLGI